jgi:hypothetical protein
VLHFVPDGAKPAQILATLRDAVSPGSYLVICHTCRDVRPNTADNATAVYNSRVAANLRVRNRDEIAALFDGFTLVSRGWYGYPNGGPTHPPMCRRTRSNSGPSSAWPGATPDSPGYGT